MKVKIKGREGFVKFVQEHMELVWGPFYETFKDHIIREETELYNWCAVGSIDTSTFDLHNTIKQAGVFDNLHYQPSFLKYYKEHNVKIDYAIQYSHFIFRNDVYPFKDHENIDIDRAVLVHCPYPIRSLFDKVRVDLDKINQFYYGKTN